MPPFRLDLTEFKMLSTQTRDCILEGSVESGCGMDVKVSQFLQPMKLVLITMAVHKDITTSIKPILPANPGDIVDVYAFGTSYWLARESQEPHRFGCLSDICVHFIQFAHQSYSHNAEVDRSGLLACTYPSERSEVHGHVPLSV